MRLSTEAIQTDYHVKGDWKQSDISVLAMSTWEVTIVLWKKMARFYVLLHLPGICHNLVCTTSKHKSQGRQHIKVFNDIYLVLHTSHLVTDTSEWDHVPCGMGVKAHLTYGRATDVCPEDRWWLSHSQSDSSKSGNCIWKTTTFHCSKSMYGQ
jgi:hypothetical protein